MVAPNGNNFNSTLGTGIGKVTPVGNIGTLRDKNASTKMEEPRSLSAGELDLRPDEMNATKIMVYQQRFEKSKRYPLLFSALY